MPVCANRRREDGETVLSFQLEKLKNNVHIQNLNFTKLCNATHCSNCGSFSLVKTQLVNDNSSDGHRTACIILFNKAHFIFYLFFLKTIIITESRGRTWVFPFYLFIFTFISATDSLNCCSGFWCLYLMCNIMQRSSFYIY